MTTTRTACTASDLTVGAIVYKGQGATAYRVTRVVPMGEGYISALLVKATTQTDSITGGMTGMGRLTVAR